MGISREIIPAVPKDRFRTGVDLIGEKDEANKLFDTPEEFEVDVDFFELFRNGQKQIENKQFSIRESSGKGVGVKIFRPPRPNESLTVNYVSI